MTRAPSRPISGLLAGGLLASLLAACASLAPSSSVSSAPSVTCSVEAAGREVLSERPGLDLYVEPRAVGPVGGGYLVAGQPTYAWVFDSIGRASRESRGAYFGVTVRDGEVERIAMPPGVGPVGWLHGAPLGGDRWAFIFQELDRPSVIEGEAQRALYGELGLDGWEVVEELEEPAGGRIDVAVSSALRPLEDGVEWATLHFGDRGGIDVLRYQRRNGEWTTSTLVEDWADAVDLIEGAGGDRWLALSGLDPHFGARLASMRLVEAIATERESVHRLVTGAVGDRFRTPRLARSATEIQTGWRHIDDRGSSAWVAVAPDGGGRSASEPSGVRVRLDDAALLAPVVVPSGPILWSTLSFDSAGRQRIRIYHVAGDTATRILDLESPFMGPFGISASSPDELLVVGPEAHADAPTPFVRSLVLRLNLVCDQVAAADHQPGS